MHQFPFFFFLFYLHKIMFFILLFAEIAKASQPANKYKVPSVDQPFPCECTEYLQATACTKVPYCEWQNSQCR